MRPIPEHGRSSIHATPTYDAAKPLNQLAGRQYPDTYGIFTVGSNDGSYRTQAKAVYAATIAVGPLSTYFEVLNGGHALGALNGGLQEGTRC